MGMTDNYKPEDSSFTGVKVLTCVEVKYVKSSKGTTGLSMKFIKDNPDHPMYKTLYQSKKFNQFLTSYVVSFGLSPMALAQACNDGQGDEWILTNFMGRQGEFDCQYGDLNRDGKRFIEPFTKPEIEFRKWVAEHSDQKAPVQTQPVVQKEYNPDDYMTPPDGTMPPADIPF